MADTIANVYKIEFINDNNAVESNTGTVTEPTAEGKINEISPTAVKGEGNKTMRNLGGALVVKHIATSAYQYGVANIGKFTGSQYLQEKVNMATKMIGYAGMIAVNPLLGTTALLTDMVIQGIDKAYERKWETIELNQARRRVGLDEIKSR